MRRLVFSIMLLAAPHGVAWGLSDCPGSANLTVFVDNLSDAPSVDVALDGALAADAVTCTGGGAASYQSTMTCTGSGLVRCGQIGGLQPGAWVHRLDVTVPGSERQEQARRLALLAGDPADASTVLLWTVYPRTYVVESVSADGPDGLPDPDGLPAKIDQATAYTLSSSRPALITFAPEVFPGARDPRRIYLFQGPKCGVADRNRCPDGETAGLCVAGDRIVVDALDRDAEPGGVILSVDTCGRQVLRLYGGDDTFRGLVFEGSKKACSPSDCATYCKSPPCACPQVDTVAITGPGARRDRIELSTVLGPTCGDTVSVEKGAGQPDDRPGDDVVVQTEITDAEDKGVKVDFGAWAIVTASCVHDNRNGGVQSTLGGHVAAVENVVQHNLPGAAQNGLSVRGGADRSTLFSVGDIVRLNGGRGLSVTDNAVAVFLNDYVADNQYSGSKVETTDAAMGPAPSARFQGVALVCNRNPNLSGMCYPPMDVEVPCTTVDDCCIRDDGSVDPMCPATACIQSPPKGLGAAMSQAAGENPPDMSYGDAAQPGRNAFTNNKNPDPNSTGGANFHVNGVESPIPAVGNQWEHCPRGAADASCDVTQDLFPADAMVDVGLILDPRATDEFRLLRVTPSRPQAGDIVRVYGLGFDAIDGNPLDPTCGELAQCSSDGNCPTGPCVNGTCPCSMQNLAVQQRNRQTVANRIRIKGPDDGVPVTDGTGNQYFYPDAVTPTMLAFRMPFDCFAPLTLEVTKHGPSGDSTTKTISLCDPKGCRNRPAGYQDRPDGYPCDDGNACTVDDHCDGEGRCLGGSPLVCDGPCLACNPSVGCVPKPATARCDDGDACTTGDHCSGDANECVGGRAVACGGQCLTGMCDPQVGCLPKPSDTPCTDGDVCTVGDHCSGESNTCLPGAPLDCGGACLTGACDPGNGCVPKPFTALCDDGNACTGGDHCSGAGDVCVPGDPLRCSGACQTGRCSPARGCLVVPSGTVCRPAASGCDVAEACDGVSGDCPPDGFKPRTEPCDDGNGCTAEDHCSGVSALCTGGGRVACDGTCDTGTCDPQVGCRPKEGLEALTCRVEECSRPRLRRKLRDVAALIDHAVETGAQPRARVVTRLTRLLARCGVSIPQPTPAR